MSRTRATRNRRSRERFSSSSSRALNSELFLPRENPKRKRLRPSARQRERERERERTMSALCVICVKLSVKLRHETLQFFPRRTSKKQNDRTQQKTIVKRASNEKRNETREKRRTNRRTGTVQKRSLLLSRRVRIIFGVVVLLCARSSFSICTSTREERTGAFISNLIRVL